MHELDAAQRNAVGIELLEASDARPAQLNGAHDRGQALCHFAREVALHREDVSELSLEVLAPDDAPLARIRKFGHEERARMGGLHATREHVLHAERLADRTGA